MQKFNKHHLEMEQLRSALRRQVRDLILEPGGDITINKYVKHESVTNGELKEEAKDEEQTVLLIDEGEVQEEVLSVAGKDRKWLMDELANKRLL